MGDTFALMRTLEQEQVQRAVIVGAGYVGLEMAEALVARGVAVTQLEQLPEVLPTVDPELGALVRAELQTQRRRACRATPASTRSTTATRGIGRAARGQRQRTRRPTAPLPGRPRARLGRGTA